MEITIFVMICIRDMFELFSKKISIQKLFIRVVFRWKSSEHVMRDIDVERMVLDVILISIVLFPMTSTNFGNYDVFRG